MIRIPDSITDYLKVEKSDKIRFRLCIVSWAGAAAPIATWHTVRAISANSSEKVIQDTLDQIISQGRFVKLCKQCDEYCVNGHMFNDELCQTCSSSCVGILY